MGISSSSSQTVSRLYDLGHEKVGWFGSGLPSLSASSPHLPSLLGLFRARRQQDQICACKDALRQALVRSSETQPVNTLGRLPACVKPRDAVCIPSLSSAGWLTEKAWDERVFGSPAESPSVSRQVAEDEVSDNSAECVVCLSDVRDTLILPCRHLCLCNTCADTLRYQANNCPICRLRKPRAARRVAAGSPRDGLGEVGAWLRAALVHPPSCIALS